MSNEATTTEHSIREIMELPSDKQIGEQVIFKTGTGVEVEGEVVSVQFTASKVFYTLNVKVDEYGRTAYIHHVDSAFVDREVIM